MFELTLRRLLALPTSDVQDAAVDARIESIRFEDLATRTLVLRAPWLQRFPEGSHLHVSVNGLGRRMAVRRVGARLHVRVTVSRDDAFAEALAFRTRAGDRILVRPLAPRA